MSNPSIAAVIAAHNEADHVAGVVEGLRPYGLHRVLVVDDSSTDGTGEIARAAGAEVLRLEPGGGKGLALRAGIAHLRSDAFDYYLFIDGDGQHDPRDFQGFLYHLRIHPGADFLIGSRFQDRANVPGRRWRTNALGSWTLGRIAGVRWEDTQSGYRLIRKRVVDQLHLVAKGFEIETEMAMKAADWKLEWGHVPIRAIYEDDWDTHFRGVKDTWRIAKFSLKC